MHSKITDWYIYIYHISKKYKTMQIKPYEIYEYVCSCRTLWQETSALQLTSLWVAWLWDEALCEHCSCAASGKESYLTQSWAKNVDVQLIGQKKMAKTTDLSCHHLVLQPIAHQLNAGPSWTPLPEPRWVPIGHQPDCQNRKRWKTSLLEVIQAPFVETSTPFLSNRLPYNLKVLESSR